MPFYLSEYIGTGTHFDPFTPVGSDQPGWSAIDLRSPDGSGLNACLLHIPVAFNDPRARFLADDKLETLTNPQKNFLTNRLGVDLSSPTLLRDIIATIMTNPPVNGWNALRPGRLRWEIWLGGLLWEAPRASGGALDDFNRPNETPLAGLWNRVSGSIEFTNLNTNELRGAVNGDKIYARTDATTSADMYSEARDHNSGVGDWGPVVRAGGGPTTNLEGYLYAVTLGRFAKFTNGTFTTISGNFDDISVDDMVRIEVEGSSISVYINGVLHTGASQPITDTSLTDEGDGPGVFIYDTTSRIDDWAGGDLGTFDLAFPIASAGDDGTGYRFATTWAGIESGTFTADDGASLWVSKTSGSASEFYADASFLRFLTSDIPDNADILAAYIEMYALSMTNNQSNTYDLAADYYDFGGEASVAADWLLTASPSIIENTRIDNLTPAGIYRWDLVDLTGISKTGYTGIRLTLSTGTPPATNANSVEFAAEEHATQPPPKLVVMYSLSETAAPTISLLPPQFF